MSEHASLKGRNIWVTGGAGYLGTAITTALDDAGATTVCIDLADKAADLVARAKLKRAIPIALDTTSSATETQVKALVAQYGVPDGLVHLAFVSSAGKSFGQISAEDFTRTVSLTLPSTFVLCRAIADEMKTKHRGSVVLFSSMYGVVAPDPRAYPSPMSVNPIDYGTTKAGLLQMTRYFAVQYGPYGVRFNAVTPGPFPNPAVQKASPQFVAALSSKTALRRLGNSPEIVGPTLFLLSDGASYVTGHSLVVDGGWTAW